MITFGLVSSILIAFSRLRKMRGRRETFVVMERLGGPLDVSDRPAPERRALLEGFAKRFSRTSLGRRVSAYAGANHAHTSFSDFLAIMMSSLIAGFMLGNLVFGRSPLVLVAAVAGPLTADRIMIRRHGRRTARIEQQLPQALHLQASALRAGHSLVRSLRVMASEVKPPLADEVGEAVREIDLGEQIEVALNNFGDRNPSRDIDLWLTALQVHRTTGGNLATTIDSLASRLRERSHLRGELRSLTAQGRLSGIVVAFAPLVFFIFLSATSREEMQILYSTPLGLTLLAAGMTMEAAGFVWIRRILRVRP